MAAATILCPTCKGLVGRSHRGQDLKEALENHQTLSHGVVKVKPNPAPDPFVPRKRVLKRTRR